MESSRRIETILNKYYSTRIKDKASSLISEIEAYVDSKDGLDNFTADLNVVDVEALCYSYFIDVARYKEYHLCPDDVKRGQPLSPFTEEWAEKLHDEEKGKRLKFSKVAALTSKWLLRYKPITIELIDGVLPQSIPPEERRIATSINQDFALLHGLSLLEIDPSKVPHQLLMDMYYHLRYRSFDERHFFMIFEEIYRSSR